MTSDQHDQIRPLVGRIAKRVNTAVWLNSSLRWLLSIMVGYAVLLLALKMVWPPAARSSVALLALIPVAFLQAYLKCKRRQLFFQPVEIVEVIDHLYRNDGAVATFFEAPGCVNQPDFMNAVTQGVDERLPRMDPTHYMKKIAPALLLVAVALLIPPRAPANAGTRAEVLQGLLRPLDEKLDEYKDILPEEDLEELEAALQELEETPREIGKEQWEAIEQLEQKIEEAAKRSEASMSSVASQLRNMAEQMEASGSASGEKLDEKTEDLLKDLKISMENPKTSLSGGVKKSVSKMMAAGMPGMSPQSLKKELDNLRKELEKLPGGT